MSWLFSLPLIVLKRIDFIYIIPLLYGAEFKPAVMISYWLAGYLLLSGFAIGFGPIYRAAKKVHLSIIFNILRSMAGGLVFVVLYYLFKISPLVSVLTFQLILGSLTTIVHFWFIKKYVLSKMSSS